VGEKDLIKKELQAVPEEVEKYEIAKKAEENLDQSIPESVHETEKFYDEIMNEFAALNVMLGLRVEYKVQLLKIDKNDKDISRKKEINKIISDINNHLNTFFSSDNYDEKAENAKVILQLCDSCLDIVLFGSSSGKKDIFISSLRDNFEKKFNLIL
jgi:hypothetical protein